MKYVKISKYTFMRKNSMFLNPCVKIGDLYMNFGYLHKKNLQLLRSGKLQTYQIKYSFIITGPLQP